MTARLTVVVPTLNASAGIEATLVSLHDLAPAEIIISDGGSVDDTVSIADGMGAMTVIGPPGRGRQLRRGADVAKGEWLLFLHADTILTPEASQEANDFMSRSNANSAAAFSLTFDDPGPSAQRVARLANWRSRTLGLPYGDQGLLISRTLYDEAGGYRDLPLMEDVDLVRRIGRPRLHQFTSAVTTSAARYRRDGWIRRPARNLTCLGLYFLGVSPARIAKFYQ